MATAGCAPASSPRATCSDEKDAAAAFVPAEAVVYFAGISKVFVVADGKVEER